MTPPFVSLKKRSSRLLSGLLFFVIILFLLIAFFRPVLFEDRQFSFRDDTYFYIPLFQQVQKYWEHGELPLWDPDTNLGQPLAANPAVSTYYVFKLLFFLPMISPVGFHSCYKLYTLFHVVWGMCGMYLLMRRLKSSPSAAIISSVAYMFAGNVLIQYCNIIFLIGAAWVPWIILCGDFLLRTPGLGSFAALSVALAMTILGGDPQAAYCSGLVLVAMALFYWRAGLLGSCSPSQSEPDKLAQLPKHRFPIGLCFSRLGLLLLSAVLAGLLTAIQIIPSSELTRHSNRTLSDMPLSVWDVSPSSIWEIPGYLGKWNAFPPGKTPEKIASNRPSSRTTGILNGLLCRQLSEGGHANEVYSFSVMPYHFADLLWPNFGGKGLPENGQWDLHAVGWFNSMYMGAFVFLLALTAFRLRQNRTSKQVSRNSTDKTNPVVSCAALRSCHYSFRRTIAVWATWIFIVGSLASLGGYGPHWFWRILQARGNTSWGIGNGDPVGGMYWFLSLFLPGFDGFRYPAKMMTFVSFALAVLAGIGWDCCRFKRILLRLISWGLVFSGGGLLFVYACGDRLFDVANLPDTFLGAYNRHCALQYVCGSLLHTVLILSLFRLVLSWARPSRKPNTPIDKNKSRMTNKQRNTVLSGCIIVLLCCDLYWAHAWTVVTCPTEFHERQSVLAEKIQQARTGEHQTKEIQTEDSSTNASQPATAQSNDGQELVPPRIYTMEWYPLVLAKRKGPTGVFIRGLWDRLSLLPNQHYSHGLQNAHLTGTMVVDQYYFCLAWTEMPDRNDISPLLAFLDVQSLILPRTLCLSPPGEEPLVKLGRNHVRLLAAAEKDTTEVQDSQGIPVDTALWQITLPTSRIKIFHECPALDDPLFTAIEMVHSERLDDRLANEYARITRYEHNCLEFETHLTQPGDIVLAEQYFPGWKAYVYRLDKDISTLGQPVEIRPTLGFFRRITLDSGTYHVVMKYRPRTFFIGAGISLTAWLLLLSVLTARFFPKWPVRTRNNIMKPIVPEDSPQSRPSV